MVMPRLSVRKIQEIIRLRFESNLSHDKIRESVGGGKTSVGDCLRRLAVSGLSWQEALRFTDTELESLLYPPAVPSPLADKPIPNWSEIHAELRKKSVTIQLLWMEYKSANPNGYQYTQFCHHYGVWRKKIDLPFRNNYLAGEKLFIDYAGQTIGVHGSDGSVRQAQIFIGVLGASNYTYAEATWTQSLPDWISSHNRMFSFLGGCPEILVPDNLRSAVQKACRYDPLINPTYLAMARHYRVAVIPARKKKPKDKAKAEQGVLLVERWILAALRNRKFFSLEELNHAIRELLARLNERPFQKLSGNRRSAFQSIDRPALKSLPAMPFELCEFKIGIVNINYHFEIDRHHYSVPYEYVQKEIEARYTSQTVEFLYRGQRIASHPRSFKSHGYTTTPEHMPPAHKEHVKWTPERLKEWVGQAGPSAAKLADVILKSRPHPQQAFTSILGMIRLSDRYGKDRLEAAAFRALRFNATNYQSLKNILQAGLDKTPQGTEVEQPKPIDHNNIRGPDYFR